MTPAGFEPTIPSSERPQTHPLDRATTGTGKSNITTSKSVKQVSISQANDTKNRHFRHLNMNKRKLFEHTSGKHNSMLSASEYCLHFVMHPCYLIVSLHHMDYNTNLLSYLSLFGYFCLYIKAHVCSRNFARMLFLKEKTASVKTRALELCFYSTCMIWSGKAGRSQRTRLVTQQDICFSRVCLFLAPKSVQLQRLNGHDWQTFEIKSNKLKHPYILRTRIRFSA
jgi:hypothetical protein